MKVFRQVYLLVFVFCFANQLVAQQVELVIQPDSLQTLFSPKPTYISHSNALDHLQELTDSLRNKGYFAISVDTVFKQDQQLIAEVYLGEQTEQIVLNNTNVDETLFAELTKRKALNWGAIELLKQKVLAFYTNQAYLQAAVQVDSLTMQGNQLVGNLSVKKGNQYKLDSLIIKGNVQLAPAYTQRFFNLEKGQLLTTTVLEQIKQRTEQSNLFQLNGEPALFFQENGTADIYLNLAEKRGNQFDLLIGLAPNPNPLLTNQKLLLTGQGNLQLLNPFGGGRELSVDYKQLQPESPILDASVYLPIVFGQRFGARGNFNLEKQDSNFVQLNYKVGANYQFEANKHLTIGYQATTSFLQQVDTSLVRQTKQLPPTSDFKRNMYFGELSNSTLNALFAPTKGIKYTINLGVGSRTIEPNSKVLQIKDSTFNYNSLYADVNENKLALQAQSELSYFIPIKNTATVLLKNQAGYRYFSNYFLNDMYRLGGINTLRGFDERSLFANMFTIQTAEYRLMLNQDSYFSVFGDGAYLQNKKNDDQNLYFGFGSGLNLATKAGLFSMQVAAGNNNNGQVDFNKTRIHFGYVNVF